jgi:hypothetical protein
MLLLLLVLLLLMLLLLVLLLLMLRLLMLLLLLGLLMLIVTSTPVLGIRSREKELLRKKYKTRGEKENGSCWKSAKHCAQMPRLMMVVVDEENCPHGLVD